MAQSISTNIGSLSAQRYAQKAQNDLSTSMTRLSSGMRINGAKDDAAGLAIAERMNSQVRGLTQASRNANDGISMAQTAESALGNIGDNLQRMRELAVQSANATNSDSDRAALQSEVKQLQQEITRVGQQSSFNGIKLLDGTFQNKSIQVGANAGESITLNSIGNSTSAGLGSHKLTLDGTITGSTKAAAATAGTNGIAVSAANLTLTTANGGTSSVVSYAANADAATIAASINTAASSVGITATATNSASLGGLSASGTVSMTLNGSAISANVANASDLSSLMAAINGVSGSTGVTANFASTTSKNALTLTTSDGRDVVLEGFTHGTAGSTVSFSGQTLTDGANDSSIKTGTVELSSSKGGITTAGAAADVFTGPVGGVTNSQFVSVGDIDISTSAGATSALSTLDAALGQINSSRADLGAVQNRLTSTISNVDATNENLQSARSRIQDTDYATESSKMSRSQVLQQAANAMLAQANQAPSQVMQLLRG